MRLIALKDIGHPINKKKGDIFELADNWARSYLLTGMAQRAKRDYRRRDMVAENSREITADDK